MNKPAPVIIGTTITAEIDAATFAIVEAVANEKGMSVGQFAAEAIQRVAESEADFHAFIQAGIDSVERGEVVPHEEVMAELDAMIEKHQARCG